MGVEGETDVISAPSAFLRSLCAAKGQVLQERERDVSPPPVIACTAASLHGPELALQSFRFEPEVPTAVHTGEVRCRRSGSGVSSVTSDISHARADSSPGDHFGPVTEHERVGQTEPRAETRHKRNRSGPHDRNLERV